MNSKKNLIYTIIKLFFIFSILSGDGTWVKYGWELFNYVIDARSVALGSSNIAYNTHSVSSSLINPYYSNKPIKYISVTHQSRYAGIANSDLIGFQLKKEKKIININVLYEGISKIPDTRSMLLDWGYDGLFGTNDLGEGNGILDEGERLDYNQLIYFNQHRLGLYCSFSYKLNQIPIGLGFKVLSYSLNNHFALGFGLDLGLIKKVNFSTVALVIRNLPASGLIWDNGTIEGTFPYLSIGFHQPLNFIESKNLKINTMGRLDVNALNGNSVDSQIRFHNFTCDMSMGVEGIYKDKFFIRLGSDPFKNLTGGLGFNWDNLMIDYTFFSSSGNGYLGNNHLISLNISLEWIFKKIIGI